MVEQLIESPLRSHCWQISRMRVVAISITALIGRHSRVRPVHDREVVVEARLQERR